jgi:hypothetical protein
MSIDGIGSVYSNLGIVPGSDRTAGKEEAQPGELRRPDPGSQSAQPPRRTADAVPSEPPAGTDPRLWEVLSPEERAFFARARALGPLTYARGRPAEGGASVPVRGGRIDLKV